MQRGALSLPVTARALYTESLALLERGDWKKARIKLLTAAGLAGDYAAPMFTLARIELLHGDTYFLPHLLEGFARLARGFRAQSILAANVAMLLASAGFGVLFISLFALLVKCWPLIDHKIRETYSSRFAFPPEGWIGPLLLLSLLILRPGFAVYTAIMILLLWAFIGRREKGLILTLIMLVSAGSYFSKYSNALVPALDPQSITSRFSSINERGATEELLVTIRRIREAGYNGETHFAAGTLLYRMGRIEEAKVELLASVAARPDFAPAFLNLGNVYFTQGDYDRALAGYQNAISRDSTNVLAYYNIGQTYIKKMLFAQSSEALNRATDLGIESYRASNPSTRIRNLTIYDQGFNSRELWSVAIRESKARSRILLSEILEPFLLFHYDRLWILLLSAWAAALLLGIRKPKSWHVFSCDNCRKPACPECAETETGIWLCRDCGGVIKGLSSVKVMEALLRHRRQKVSRGMSVGARWKTLLFPGIAHIYKGRFLSGIIISFVNISAILALVWGGFYFEETHSLYDPVPLWKMLLPAAVILLGYLTSLRAGAKQEQRNYMILPPEMEVRERESNQLATGFEPAVKKEPIEVL